ncbi:hypothetical protein [Thiothrix sp.]|jgi:hypothetical protein|uniref:hypothetical protein n=1 Tax=Thiothrix sp. TaxID=1032 RepID=UPI00257E9581|nr:hypothetical protein [Thiothrix sp.]
MENATHRVSFYGDYIEIFKLNKKRGFELKLSASVNDISVSHNGNTVVVKKKSNEFLKGVGLDRQLFIDAMKDSTAKKAKEEVERSDLVSSIFNNWKNH